MNNLARILPIFVVLTLVGLGAAGYFYYQYQQTQKEIQSIKTDNSNVAKVQEEEVNRLIEQVGKLIALPEDEKPTVATITDIEKLREQPFFAKAKNGDKVLIYANAKKAILFDPIAQKIIDVAPVNIGTPSASQAVPAKVALLNGTSIRGLTTQVENEAKAQIPDINIVSRGNASRSNYTETTVVVLADTAKAAGDNLAQVLNVKVADLPAGEQKPTGADLVVILGSDRSSTTTQATPTRVATPTPAQ